MKAQVDHDGRLPNFLVFNSSPEFEARIKSTSLHALIASFNSLGQVSCEWLLAKDVLAISCTWRMHMDHALIS